jgi:hypothetical protein
VVEKFHKMAESPKFYCPDCLTPLEKNMSDGFVKRSDARWIEECANGAMNDLTEVQRGRQEMIATREQARAKIRHEYRDPYPRPSTDSEVAANKRVGLLRTRYLERY